MAEFKHKDNTGSLFSNNKKGNDKAPDWKGTINVDGKEFQIAAWERQGNKGDFFSLKIEPPYKPQHAEPSTADDLPF